MSFSCQLDRESMWSFIILIGYRNGVHPKKGYRNGFNWNYKKDGRKRN